MRLVVVYGCSGAESGVEMGEGALCSLKTFLVSIGLIYYFINALVRRNAL